MKSNFSREMVAYAGEYSFTALPPMSAQLWAVYDGHKVGLKTQSIIPKMNSTIDLSVKPSTIKATVLTPWGTPAPGLAVDLVDLTNGRVTTQNTSNAGEVTFTNLVQRTVPHPQQQLGPAA